MKMIFKCLIGLLLLGFGTAQISWTLDDFLSQIEESNRDLQLAEQELKMAKVYRNEARSTALPKLMLEGNYTRNLDLMYMYVPGFFFGDSSGGSVAMPINYKNDYNYSLVLNQPLFDANAFYARRAARELAHMTDNIYELSRSTVYTYARKVFYQTLLAKQFYQVSLDSETSAKENFELLRIKHEQGLVSELDLLMAEVRWQNAIPESKTAYRNYELALNSLKKMAGVDLDKDIVLDGSFHQYPELPPEQDLSVILENRPDYQALKWEEQLRSTNVKSQWASYLPQISGNAIFAFSGASDDFKIENDNSVRMLGLNLSWPIWLGGYQEAQIQRARVDVRKNQLQLVQLEADITIEIRNIRLRLMEAQDRITAAEQLVSTAEKAFTISETTARTGMITQLELKDARIGYDQSQLAYYAAVFDYLDAYFDWQLAIGQ